LKMLWSVGVPAALPNRFAFVALVDAIIGEIISARDAHRKSLQEEIRDNDLKPWKSEIFGALHRAGEGDNWLARVEKLRNRGLHGSYLPENIRIGGSPSLDMRLVGYEAGIIADVPLPEDFALVCDKMEELAAASRTSVGQALLEKEREATLPTRTFGEWFVEMDI